jgi:hypothetical protein
MGSGKIGSLLAAGDDCPALTAQPKISGLNSFNGKGAFTFDCLRLLWQR